MIAYLPKEGLLFENRSQVERLGFKLVTDWVGCPPKVGPPEMEVPR
jgi:hypothetical protein